MYFYKGFDYGEKVDLGKDDWNPKRKMWVTTHFLEIIKQPEFENNVKIQRMYAWLPLIFFLDSDTPCQDLLFPHSHKPRKNIVVLVGKFLKKLEYPKMCRMYVR